ncbi:vesicle-associated protein 1-1-like [Andrographis paniculata]|uniref:vesicle-associated protein 1-1-like n=1 Tax=Andrographis paniculata TaxID=175694 RepID=UPI0021E878D4|nr:vesicle-associated protein 1-1-like [Andrographis paniculata]
MSSGEILNVEPREMTFPFELKKQISCSVLASNKTDNHVAFKIKTTNPKKYCVRPNTGVVSPHSTCDIVVTMQAQKEAPPDMQCKDKFLVQSVVATPGLTSRDITPEMFNKQLAKVEECKLKVVYVTPRRPPSPVAEGTEEGFSPKTITVENRKQEVMKQKSSKSGGVTISVVLVIGLIGAVLGYLVRRP